MLHLNALNTLITPPEHSEHPAEHPVFCVFFIVFCYLCVCVFVKNFLLTMLVNFGKKINTTPECPECPEYSNRAFFLNTPRRPPSGDVIARDLGWFWHTTSARYIARYRATSKIIILWLHRR